MEMYASTLLPSFAQQEMPGIEDLMLRVRPRRLVLTSGSLSMAHRMQDDVGDPLTFAAHSMGINMRHLGY
jgi:hypothetical protein